jgi:hypothetical protein
VVWEVGAQSSVHVLIPVIRGRAIYHGDLVAKLNSKANSGLHARVGDEPDDNELVDAMLFEQQVQVRVGKAAGAPMLLGYDVARLRLKLAADFSTPRSVFEALVRPGCLLDGRNVLPSLVVARAVAPMQRIEDSKPAFRAAFRTSGICGTQ